MSRTILTLILAASSVLLGGCAHQILWQDATGQGRGSPEFTADSGTCQLVAQNYANQQQELVNEQNANGCHGTSRQCGMLGLIQGIGINVARTNSYNACMNEHGWGEQQYAEPNKSQYLPNTIVPTTDIIPPPLPNALPTTIATTTKASDSAITQSSAIPSLNISPTDRLRNLKTLYKDGVINKKEYETKKKEVLDSM